MFRMMIGAAIGALVCGYLVNAQIKAAADETLQTAKRAGAVVVNVAKDGGR